MKRLLSWALSALMLLQIAGPVWAVSGVSIDISASPAVGAEGKPLTYTISLVSDTLAKAVGVTDALPSGIDFVSAASTQGSCSGTTTIQCAMGDLPANTLATVTIHVTPRISGNVTDAASVSSTGDTTNSASVTTLVEGPPQLTSLVPSSAIVGSPATSLTVNGSHFISGATILWNGSPLPTTFVSGSQLTTTIPASDLTTVQSTPVTVENPDQQVSNPLTFSVVNAPAPVLTSLVPNSALVGSGATALTVNGSNFVSGAIILWNGASLSTTFVSSTQLTTTIPASDLTTAKSVPVTVKNPDQQVSNTLTFTIVNPPAPVLTSLVPSSALVGSGATPLTVNGSNFVSGATILWNGSTLSTTFVSSTQLTTTIPASDLTTVKSVPVTVKNPDQQVSNTLTFTIVNPPAPVLTSLVPSSALVGSGATALTVNGSNFVSGATILWNGSTLPTTFVSSTQLTTTIPASDLTTVKSVPVTVKNPDQQVSNTLTFTIVNPPAPVLTSLVPNSAMVGSGATFLTVNGSHFVSGAVILWNNASLPTTFINSTQLTTTIPASDLSTIQSAVVTVKNPDQQISNGLNFAVTSRPPAPSLTSLVPNSAIVGASATALTVNGSNFVSGATVLWNGSPLPATFVSSTKLTTTIPASDLTTVQTVQVTVKNPDQQISNGLPFKITPIIVPVATIVITPNGIYIPVNTPQQFVAHVYDAQSKEITGLSFTWSLNSSGDGAISRTGVFQGSGAKIYTVAATVSGGTYNGLSTTAHITLLAPSAPCDLSHANPFPVPYKASSGLPGVTFTHLTKGTQIRIYSTDGRPVQTLASDDGSDRLWDMKNSDGNVAASGVYFYFLTTSACDQKKNGKLMLIR